MFVGCRGTIPLIFRGSIVPDGESFEVKVKILIDFKCCRAGDFERLMKEQV